MEILFIIALLLLYKAVDAPVKPVEIYDESYTSDYYTGEYGTGDYKEA